MTWFSCRLVQIIFRPCPHLDPPALFLHGEGLMVFVTPLCAFQTNRHVVSLAEHHQGLVVVAGSVRRCLCSAGSLSCDVRWSSQYDAWHTGHDLTDFNLFPWQISEGTSSASWSWYGKCFLLPGGAAISTFSSWFGVADWELLIRIILIYISIRFKY